MSGAAAPPVGALAGEAGRKPRFGRMEWALALGVLVFAAGMAGAAFWGGGRQALDVLGRVKPALLPCLLALSLGNYASRGARWLLLSRRLRLGVPAAANLLIYVAGFAMTTTPGKMGEALRLWLLNRRFGVRYERSAALLVADRLCDAVGTTLVVSVTVLWFARYRGVALVAVAAVAGLVALCLRPVLLLRGVDLAYGLLRRWPRLFVRARRIVRGLGELGAPAVLAPAILLSVLGWLCEGASFALLLHGLGVGLAPLAAVFVFCFGMLVGAISVLPGGLGSTEATMIGLLAAQAVPLSTAIVATGIVRVTTLWFAVMLGLAALPFAVRLQGGRLARG